MSESNLISGEWYWSKRGSDERNGPVSSEEFKELAEEGDLEPDDLVWTEGMDDWQEASSVEGVKDFFESPPPLPEESEKQGGTQEEAPPPLSQDEKPETEEEYSFPVRFEVKNPALPGCLLPISSVPLGSAVIAQQHQYGNGGLPPFGSVWFLQNRISLS